MAKKEEDKKRDKKAGKRAKRKALRLENEGLREALALTRRVADEERAVRQRIEAELAARASDFEETLQHAIETANSGAELSGELARLRDRLEHTTAVGEQVAWSFAELQMQHAASTEELNALREEAAALRAERDGLRVEATTLKAELATALERMQSAESARDRAAAAAEEAARHEREAREAAAAAADEAENMRSQFRELTAAVDRLRSERDAAAASEQAITAQVETLKSAQHDSIAEGQAVARSLAEAREAQHHAEEALAQAQADLAARDETIQELHSTVDEARSEATHLRTRIATLEGDAAAAAENLAQLHTRVEELKTELAVRLRCPRCGGTFIEEHVEDLAIDRCTGCEALFFDDGEVDRLIAILRERMTGDEDEAPVAAARWLRRLLKPHTDEDQRYTAAIDG